MALSRPMPIRMVAVAVTGFLGIAGLSGCASSPNTAATVVCHAMVRDFAGLFHLFDREGEKKAMADLAAVEVKTNPRLGTWDAKNLAVHGSSSLSDPFTSRS